MDLRPIAAVLIATALMAYPSRAHADPPQCATTEDAIRVALQMPLDGSISRIATLPEPDGSLFVALRVLPRRARGTTRVLAGAFDAHGTWTTPLHEITTFPARLDGPIGIAAANGTHRVLIAGTRALRSVQLPPSGDPVVANISSSTRFADRVAAFTSLGDRFRLAWTTPHGVEVRDLPADGPLVADAHNAQAPERTRVVSIAPGPDDGTGLVMQTSARRYYIATLTHEGRFQWSGNAPAGCSRHFCAGVQLHASPGGFVATWVNRRDRDGLATPGAWTLDARGHGRGGRHEFLPMVRGMGIAGPHGEPLALQFARPLVLRGAAAPIAVASPPEGSRALPRVVDTFVRDESLVIAAAWDDGAITVSRVSCH